VGGEAGDADFDRVLAEHLPDNLLAQAFARDAVAAKHGPEDMSFGSLG